MGDNWSNADGIGIAKSKRIACRQKCNFTHPFNKAKRASCMTECDNAFNYQMSKINLTIAERSDQELGLGMPLGAPSPPNSEGSTNQGSTNQGLGNETSGNTTKYVIAGIAALAVIGGIIYFARKK